MTIPIFAAWSRPVSPPWVEHPHGAAHRRPCCSGSGFRSVGEGVGEECVGGQAALRKILSGRIDHRRRTAGIDLVAGQIVDVLEHGSMHEPGAAAPAAPGGTSDSTGM